MPRSMITRLSIQALFIGLLTIQAVQAQTKDASAILQLDSTTQGLLPPRMTAAQRDAIATPAKGLMIFNTSTDKIDFFDGTSWVVITASTDAVPTGTVDAFAGSTAPTGYLLCDGSVISRTTYADLFSVIGTTYGTGDGSATFKLPDLRGEFIRGVDRGRGVDSGRALGSFQNDAFKSHNHRVNYRYNTVRENAYNQNTNNYLLHNAGGTSNYTSQNSGETETRPRNIVLNYIIKY